MSAYLIANTLSTLAEAEPTWNVVDLFQKGGSLMWALLVLSVLAVMMIFICLWTTRGGAILPQRMVMDVESYLRRKDYVGLLNLCEKDDSCFGRTVHVIILFMQRNPRATIEEVREVAEAEATRQSNMLSRQISWLADIGALAPMIGLLGTVWGMMQTFKEMADGNFEGVKQMQMASGIYEAMITTAGGLVLAIPSMFTYVFFRNRIQKHVTNMEVAVTHILSFIAMQMDREQRLGKSMHRSASGEKLYDDED